jgi:hypothetical protein
MKKLGIVITDGEGFKNFILSNIIKEVSWKFYALVIYSGFQSYNNQPSKTV